MPFPGPRMPTDDAACAGWPEMYSSVTSPSTRKKSSVTNWRFRPCRHVQTAFINDSMLITWNEILPSAIDHLSSTIHREIVAYYLSLPGKRHPTYRYAFETWNLSRDEFDGELSAALSGIRAYLREHFNIHSSSDLELP